MKTEFKQKKINHVVHYTKTIDDLLSILKNGFAPSYCYEKINTLELYIPMVSFCNIPIKDVKSFMNYGNYGIGMSIDRAKEKKLSPVTYIHENTPFNRNQVKILNIANKIFNNTPNEDYVVYNYDDFNQISNLTFEILMYIKNIHIVHDDEDIITYNEREWRFVPNLNESSEKQFILRGFDEFKFLHDDAYKLLDDNRFKVKPHLPNHALKLDLNAIKYIFVESQSENILIVDALKKLYGDNTVIEAITSGNLLILNHEILENDF